MKGPGGSYSSESGLFGGLNNTADEDSSDFGPIGAVVLLAVPVVTVFAYFARRVDSRQLALACALPLFLVVLALGSTFNVWLGRFLIVPVVLTAPLFAMLFRGRAATAAYLAVGVLVAVLVVGRRPDEGADEPARRAVEPDSRRSGHGRATTGGTRVRGARAGACPPVAAWARS